MTATPRPTQEQRGSRCRFLGASLALILAIAVPRGTDAQAQESDAPGFRAPTLRPLEVTRPLEIGLGSPLTLDEVLESVERHHPTIDAADARVEGADGLRLAAEGAFDLTVSTRATGAFVGYYEYGRLDVALTQPTPLWGATVFGGWRTGRGFNRGGIPDYYRFDETLDGGELRLGVSVPLWRDGPIDSRRATLWRAEHGVNAAREERDARELRVSLAAAEAYIRWVAAGRRYLVAAELLRIAEQRDAQIGARAMAGAIPPIEHLENRRAVLERRQGLVAARRLLEQRAITLSLYLRDDSGSPRQVEPSRVPAAMPRWDIELASESADLEAARASRPELRRFAAHRRAAVVSQELAENQISPRIDVRLAGSIDLGGAGVSDPDRAYEIQRTLERPQLDAMLSIEIPLQLREARGRAAQARAELAALDAETELAEDQVRLETLDARSAVLAALEAVALAEESEIVARAVAEAERVRFDSGASTLLIVNLRESAAATAAQAHLDALADLAVAHAWRAAALGQTVARR